MNDLDLRAALHRDADLVGEPAPDLLDQLARRGDQQRRRRAGLLAAGLSVAVIGAAVPVAATFMTHADSGPAVQTTDEPMPTTFPDSPTPEVPEVSPTPSSDTAVVEAPADASPPCPDHAVVAAALPADSARITYRAHPGEPVCSGVWAGFGYTRTEFLHPGDTFQGYDDHGNPAEFVTDTDEVWPDATAGLLRYENGSWTFHPRDDYCDKVTLPDVIWERVCSVD